MKIKFFSLFLVTASMLFGFNAVASDGMDVPNIKAKVVVSGLDNPWDMAFTSGGDMFYTEKCKGLSVRTKGGKTHALYGMKGSSGYAGSGNDLFCEGQAGMLGVALDRDFAENRTLYLYSTSTKYHGSGCKTNFEKSQTQDKGLQIVWTNLFSKCVMQHIRILIRRNVENRVEIVHINKKGENTSLKKNTKICKIQSIV